MENQKKQKQIEKALLKKALGYQAKEVVEEFMADKESGVDVSISEWCDIGNITADCKFLCNIDHCFHNMISL